MVELRDVENESEGDMLDSLLSGAGKRMLFDDMPVGLNALFRFQIGSNVFDGERDGFASIHFPALPDVTLDLSSFINPAPHSLSKIYSK